MKFASFCGHQGNTPGFSSDMRYLPDKDATMIVNVNLTAEYGSTSSEALAEALAEAITKMLFPKHVEW